MARLPPKVVLGLEVLAGRDVLVEGWDIEERELPKVPVLRELLLELRELPKVPVLLELLLELRELPKVPVLRELLLELLLRLPPKVPVLRELLPVRLVVPVVVVLRLPPNVPREALMSPRFTVTRVLLLRPVEVVRAPRKSPRS